MSEERIVDLLGVWKADLEGQNMAPRGIESYRRALIRFVDWADPDVAVEDLTEDLITAYRDAMMARGQAPKSVGLWLTVIRNFCGWGVRTKRLASDPTAAIKWPKLPRSKPRRLTSAEWDALHRAVAAPRAGDAKTLRLWRRNRLAIYVLAYAGLRLAEAAALDWREVDLPRRELRVLDGKGNKDRDVPISEALVVELERVPVTARVGAVCGKPDGEPLTPKSLAHIFERWLPAQGLDDVSAHRLRHTAATLMRAGGADVKDIADVLGHESIETTQIYLGPDPARLRAAVNAIPAPPPEVLTLVVE